MSVRPTFLNVYSCALTLGAIGAFLVVTPNGPLFAAALLGERVEFGVLLAAYVVVGMMLNVPACQPSPVSV